MGPEARRLVSLKEEILIQTWREDLGRKWPSTSRGGRPGTDPSFMALRRRQPCPHVELRLPAYGSVRKESSVVYATPSVALPL